MCCLFFVKARGSFEKVGEATEAALITLVEKLNLTGVDKSALSKMQLCNACSEDVAKGVTKVVRLSVTVCY